MASVAPVSFVGFIFMVYTGTAAPDIFDGVLQLFPADATKQKVRNSVHTAAY